MAKRTSNSNLYLWEAEDQKIVTFQEYNETAKFIDSKFASTDAQLADKATKTEDVTYNGVTTKFYNQSTTLYVDLDSTVVSGNDGLTSDKPIKLADVQTIFNTLKTVFPKLMGSWVVQLSSGTYQSDGTNHLLYLSDVDSENYIELKGSSVVFGDVPSTIIDGKVNGTPYMHGFFFQNMKVKVSDIKFQNFTEGTTPSIPTGSRAGLSFSGTTGKILAYNVHTYNCSWGGLINQGIPRVYVQGGKYEYCRYGILSMFNTTVTIGYGGSSSSTDNQKTRIVNCTEAGVIIQSQSNGHVDYTIFDGNTSRALLLALNCEINGVSNIFRNNNMAVSVQVDGRFLNSGCTFTNNTQDTEFLYNGKMLYNDSTEAINKRRGVDQLIEDSTYFTTTAPSGGGVMFTQQIPASSLFGRGKQLNFEVFGRFTNNNANTSQFLVKATDGTNSVVLQTISLPTTGAWNHWNLEFYLINYAKTQFYYHSKFNSQATGNVISNNVGFTLDSTKQITLTIEEVVTGVPADTTVNLYKVIPRLAY